MLPAHYTRQTYYLLIKRGHPLYLPLLAHRVRFGYCMEFSLAVARALGANDFVRGRRRAGGGISFLKFKKAPGFCFKEEWHIKQQEFAYVPDPERLVFFKDIKFPVLMYTALEKTLPMCFDYIPTIYYGDGEILLESALDIKIEGAYPGFRRHVKQMKKNTDRMYNTIERSPLYRIEETRKILHVLQKYQNNDQK